MGPYSKKNDLKHFFRMSSSRINRETRETTAIDEWERTIPRGVETPSDAISTAKSNVLYPTLPAAINLMKRSEERTLMSLKAPTKNKRPVQ